MIAVGSVCRDHDVGGGDCMVRLDARMAGYDWVDRLLNITHQTADESASRLAVPSLRNGVHRADDEVTGHAVHGHLQVGSIVIDHPLHLRGANQVVTDADADRVDQGVGVGSVRLVLVEPGRAEVIEVCAYRCDVAAVDFAGLPPCT
jgi:hypothetical protein